MRLTLTGTGPAEGFPAPDCPCAACSRARRDGTHRAPARLESPDGWAIGVDGVVEWGRVVARVEGVVAGVRVRSLLGRACPSETPVSSPPVKMS